MDNEFLSTILSTTHFYTIISLSTMIITIAGCVVACVYLILRKKFYRISSLDVLTINLCTSCVIFSITNFIPYSYSLFNQKTPPLPCKVVQAIQCILWYNEFYTFALIIIERTYYHISPINHMKKFGSPYFIVILSCGWIIASILGIMTSLSYNWDKIHVNYSLEICLCESLVFNNVDLVIQVGSYVIPYVLVISSFVIARICALKAALKAKKDLGLEVLNRNCSFFKFKSLYEKNENIGTFLKAFYIFLCFTHSLKILFALLKEFNNYQKVIHMSLSLENKSYATKPYMLPITVIGFFNILYMIAPLYDLICCVLINQSFFKDSS